MKGWAWGAKGLGIWGADSRSCWVWHREELTGWGKERHRGLGAPERRAFSLISGKVLRVCAQAPAVKTTWQSPWECLLNFLALVVAQPLLPAFSDIYLGILLLEVKPCRDISFLPPMVPIRMFSGVLSKCLLEYSFVLQQFKKKKVFLGSEEGFMSYFHILIMPNMRLRVLF